MPGFDGTGPMGQGPLTGRGMGFCVMKLSEATGNADFPDEVANDLNRREVSTMPRGDGTGPLGFGPMTGRAAGYCAGYPIPGHMNPMPGMGFGRRLMVGAYAPPTYAGAMVPYGYTGRYVSAWGRAIGWWGRGFVRGWGRGFGRGRGRGRRWW